MDVIEVSGVVKAFGSKRALDGATLSVSEGEVYGLAGRNGAGKSTLVRHVMGAYRPDAGSVLVGGRDPYADARARERMLCVYDEVFHWAGSSLRDLAGLYRKVHPGYDRARFGELGAAFAGIDPKAPLRRMSRGMRKQASLWLALACRPEVLVLDEPLDGLDPLARREVWRLLRADVEGRGMAVLLCSHNLRELEGFSERVGFMDAGRVVAELDARGMTGDALEAAFVSALGENSVAVSPLPADRAEPGILRLRASRSAQDDKTGSDSPSARGGGGASPSVQDGEGDPPSVTSGDGGASPSVILSEASGVEGSPRSGPPGGGPRSGGDAS